MTRLVNLYMVVNVSSTRNETALGGKGSEGGSRRLVMIGETINKRAAIIAGMSTQAQAQKGPVELAVTERLIGDRRWPAVVKLLYSLCNERGMDRESAFGHIDRKFPPVDIGKSSERPSFDPKVEKDYRLAIEWTAHNIADENVTIAEAPSMAAWGLLNWARTQPKDFYTNLFAKVLPTQKQLEREARYVDDGRALRLVEELLKETKDGG